MFELRAWHDGKAKTNVDGVDPLGSLLDGKRSPLPTYARVLANRCADGCDSRANK